MLARLFVFLTALSLRLLGARRRGLRKGGVALAYYELGPKNGEPWVLLHGLGSVAAGWGPVMRALRRDCRLLVPELSALGGTECPGEGLGIHPAVEILTELLDKEFGGRPVTVAGLSLGGWTAVRLALAHPERVSRLVLIDVGGYRDQDWETIQSLVTVDDLAGVDRLYPALFVRVPWLMRISRTGFLKTYTSPSVRNVLAGLTEADTFDDADLARLRMPVELIWGEHDGLFTLETGRAMAAALPNARLQVLPGRGHALHLECPGELVAALQRLRRTVAPAGSRIPSTSPQ
ncbi:MAG TPA: alpha/beta hydrolase [Thermoanaerobaculia bacterium]|jgi:pimeloyl-ACP methyl ester carboxylesterase|nr:alpha/beta hydrolase [Thermoanaerobaculia bacterium]